MGVIRVPYHLDERLEAFDLDAPIQAGVDRVLPEADLWSRLTVIYDRLGEVISECRGRPIVVSGDRTTCLGTLTRVADLLYPAAGGTSFSELLTAIERISARGDIAAVGIAATWRHGTVRAAEHRRQLAYLIDAASRG